MLGARRIDRDSGRSEAKLGAEWGSVRENQAFGTCSRFVRKSSRCILKYKKLLGAGKDLGTDSQRPRLQVYWQPVPAVDKKRNPTGYSKSDDEDVPFF